MNPGSRYPKSFRLHFLNYVDESLECFGKVVVDNRLVKPVAILKLDSLGTLEDFVEFFVLKTTQINNKERKPIMIGNIFS